MQKNCEYEGVVEGLGTDGEGIIKIGGTTAFVPFCLVGERVRFKALKVKGNIAYGKLLKVLSPSDMRAEPVCPVFTKCGGCDLQHMRYSEQLKFKRDAVLNALNKIGGIYTRVNDCVECGKEYGYRNKLVLPINIGNDGNPQVGFYARHSHRIVPTEICAIQSDWAKDVFDAVYAFAKGENGKYLRHIVVREIKGKFIFALVAVKSIDVKPLIKELEKNFSEFTFLLNIKSEDTNVIFGKEWRICRGEGFFEAEENGIKYKAGANTFLQVNDDVREKLYESVLAEAEADAVTIDLYSGGGMLTAMLAKKCKSAYGIEIVEEASRCADELALANGLQIKMHNICGAVEENIDRVFALTEGSRRIIVCDPPRKGMERSVVRAISHCKADKVVLVSCNPATLARDLGLILGTLTESGGALVKSENAVSDYKIESVTPFDMFPQTKWCETLVTLFHKKPDSHIEVTVDFENGKIKKDGIIERVESKKPKEKPTYKTIQKWVEENYGLKVHTAYIAEVKRDLGLPMYDAPNAVEELKRPRAHPNPRMVKAIKAALEHFEII